MGLFSGVWTLYFVYGINNNKMRKFNGTWVNFSYIFHLLMIFFYRGSISKVMVDEYNIGISASYDCTMIIWFFIDKNILYSLKFSN